MSGYIGIIIAVLGLLIAIGVIFKNDKIKERSIVCFFAIFSLFLVASGTLIIDQYAFRCCDTPVFTSTCKVCGYKINPEDRWYCCEQFNYMKYCSICGKEKGEKIEEDNAPAKNGYIYCCDNKYNMKYKNYCSVCGEKLEETSNGSS